MNLKRRIERLYMAITGHDNPRGSKAWFAREAGYSRRAVTSWCASNESVSKKKPGSKLVYRLLEEREVSVGDAPLEKADRQLDALHDKDVTLEIQAIRWLVDEGGYSITQIANAMGRDKGGISRIYNRTRQADIPDPTPTERIDVVAFAKQQIGIQEPVGIIATT